MYWFKHYNNATQGLSLRNLWDGNDMEAYALWWHICELVSRWEDRDDEFRRGKITINISTLRRETGWKGPRLISTLRRIQSEGLIHLDIIRDQSVILEVCNWLKFQETRGKKKSKQNQIVAGDNRSKITDIRYKNKDIEIDDQKSLGAKHPSPPILKKGSSNSRLIAEYIKAYQGRYKARPVIDGRTQGLVKKILSAVSEDQACDLVQAFLQMNDPWFVKKAHDFPTFYENLTKISMALQTGQDHGAPQKEKSWKELLQEDERKLPDGH